MNMVKLAGTALAIGLVSVASLTLGTAETHAGPPPSQVIVANADTQPVPVSGAVYVANDDNVRLYVHGVEKPEPFSQSQTAGATAPSMPILVVPADRRAVVESVSCTVTDTHLGLDPSYEMSVKVKLWATLTSGKVELIWPRANNEFVDTREVRFYTKPGDSIYVRPSGTTVSGTWTCSVFGYLVPA